MNHTPGRKGILMAGSSLVWKFLNCFNININSMKVGKKKMSKKCGIWLTDTI